MAPVFYFYYNDRRTSWNGNLSTFMRYPKDKQIHLLYALEVAPVAEKDKVRAAVTLSGPGNLEGADMINFIRSGISLKPAPEISILACVRAMYNNENCSVCLEPFTDVRQMAVATRCRHVFCRECIVKWAHKSKTCPVCRGGTDKSLIHLGERDAQTADCLLAMNTAKKEDHTIHTRSYCS